MVELKEADIMKIKNGAKFYRADLHIHTPASGDFVGKAEPLDIVRIAIEKGLNIIAITDHNTVEWCERVIKAAKGTPLVVLPGVEISMPGGTEGIHIIGVFNKDTPEECIGDLLARVGLTSEKRGKQEALANCTFDKLFDEICTSGGIPIAAHSDQNKGLANSLRGQQRIGIIRNEKLRVLEVVDKKVSKYFDGTDPNYKRKIACIQGSDAHSVGQIGTRVTRLKMDKPGLEGLKQAFLDQESRVRFDDDERLTRPRPRIIGMKISGSFLDGQIFHFNENLNCLIGGRGTGKSSTIELLRYCLNSLPESEDLKNRKLQMIKNILGEGTVSTIVETRDGTQYRIERSYDSAPTIYNAENTQVEADVKALFEIVGYGENEIEGVSYDPIAQLNLIDCFIEDVDELKKDEGNILDLLKANAVTLSQELQDMTNAESTLADLPTVREKLRELKKYNFDRILAQQLKREQERTLVDSISEAITQAQDCAEDITIASELEQVLKGCPGKRSLRTMPNKVLIKKAVSIVKTVHRYLVVQRQSEVKFLKKRLTNLHKLLDDLDRRHTKEASKTKEIIEKLGARGLKDAAKKFLALQSKMAKLEKLREKVSRRKERIEKILMERNNLKGKLRDVRTKLYNARKECSRDLTENLAPSINIDIAFEGNRDIYYAALKKALEGSRIRSAEIERMVKHIHPFDFCNMVQSEDVRSLMDKASISENWAKTVIHFPSVKERLFEIETVQMPDRPTITLKVGSMHKTLDSLSLGQRCTTLLSIIMLESDLPLIIDQPEEGLDNIFVFDNVVKTLRNIKERRQLILATHSANIPVSGDAELILALESDGEKGWIHDRGSIDENEIKEQVQVVLEGGKEAFKIRKDKYGY